MSDDDELIRQTFYMSDGTPHTHIVGPAEKCEICLLRADLDKANARITELVTVLQETVFGGVLRKASMASGYGEVEPFNVEKMRERIAALEKP